MLSCKILISHIKVKKNNKCFFLMNRDKIKNCLASKLFRTLLLNFIITLIKRKIKNQNILYICTVQGC